MTQVDGNFSLQQARFTPGPEADPSMIGDRGFWSPEKLFNDYITAMGSKVIPEEVVSSAQGSCAYWFQV